MEDGGSTKYEAGVLVSLRTGSTAAFEVIMRRYYLELHAYAARWLRSTTAADDVLQETFLRLWTHRATLEVHTTLRAYLYAATRGHLLMHQRRERARNRHITPNATGLDVHDSASPFTDLTITELTATVQATIDRMPDRTREVFALSREQGLSYNEIAEVMEISVNTVKTQLGRALSILREAAAPFLGILLLLSR